MNKDEIPIGKAKDLRGKKFGKLTPLYRVKSKPGETSATWKCQCDCGNYTNVLAYNLTSGHTQSCGCKIKEILTIRNKTQSLGSYKKINLIGKTYGYLTVIQETEKQGHNTYWICQCQCGNKIKVRTDHLQREEILSCGCLTMSKGELKIYNLLKENNIPFEQEKTFNDCRFNNNYLAKFDFFIDNKYIIEYDGEQHFKCGTGLFNNLEEFQKTQEHDNFKNQYCKKNNIPLIRIPYTKYNTLCIEDLKLETTNFKIF